jgi:L-arabinokinase
VPELLRRIRAELPAFGVSADAAVRVARAPGRLDVMGGIADYTGSLVCEGTLDRAAAVALAPRGDRDVQVFSFNLYDERQPFTLRIPLAALATESAERLRAEFNQPGRKWAAYLAGCLFVLHEERLVDLNDPAHAGLDIALYSTVPLGAGVSSSAAIEVATMMALRDHFNLAEKLDAMRLAALCQRVETRVVGAPCGIMDQVTCTAGHAGALLELFCQPHEIRGYLQLPEGVRCVGINSAVRHSVGGGQYGRTRCAAFMGHRIILSKMAEMGRAAGRELIADPMGGYLANLPLEDYKTYFRPYLPETIKGDEFLERYGPTVDTATAVEAGETYAVRSATDHHVHEARRVVNFVQFLEEAARQTPHTAERSRTLDKAGHLMYGSHVAYTRDALLGAEEADLLVDLVRRHERGGLYGAKITGGGLGGTVAVLANVSAQADEAIGEIARIYRERTGKVAEVFWGSSPGAWEVGTGVTRLQKGA